MSEVLATINGQNELFKQLFCSKYGFILIHQRKRIKVAFSSQNIGFTEEKNECIMNKKRVANAI